MSSSITYNGFQVLSEQPTPLVTRQPAPVFLGNGVRQGLAQTYQLVGQITGCSFTMVTGKMAELSQVFSSDFGSLVFQDDDGYSVTHSGVRVNRVDFEQGQEVGIQNYTVDLTCYPQDYFANAGILVVSLNAAFH